LVGYHKVRGASFHPITPSIRG